MVLEWGACKKLVMSEHNCATAFRMSGLYPLLDTQEKIAAHIASPRIQAQLAPHAASIAGVVYGKHDATNPASSDRALRLIRSPALLRPEGATKSALDALGVSPGRAIVLRDYARVPTSDARRVIATGMLDSTNVRMFRQNDSTVMGDSRYVIDVAASMISPSGHSLTFSPQSSAMHAFFLATLGNQVAGTALAVTGAATPMDEGRDDDAARVIPLGVCFKCGDTSGYCSACCENTTPDQVREFMEQQGGGRTRVGCVAWRGAEHAPPGRSLHV